MSSFVDRQIIAVVGESIRLDLGLNFTALGWLYGPALAGSTPLWGLSWEAWPIDTPECGSFFWGGWSFATIAVDGRVPWLLVAMRMALDSVKLL